MTRHREAIDDTIDRVAAELTLVAADPELPGRITAHLERQPRMTFGWRLAIGAAATAAAAMLAAFVLNAPPSPAIDHARTADALPVSAPSREIAPAAVAAPAPIVPTRDRVARVASVPRGASAIEPLPEFRQIDALPSPAMLAVDDLNTDLLTVAPVDVAPLDLANLVVGEVAARDEPKE
jgi:hypothetical protein